MLGLTCSHFVEILYGCVRAIAVGMPERHTLLFVGDGRWVNTLLETGEFFVEQCVRPVKAKSSSWWNSKLMSGWLEQIGNWCSACAEGLRRQREPFLGIGKKEPTLAGMGR